MENRNLLGIFHRCLDVAAYVSAGLIMVLMLLTVADVGGRFLLNQPLAGTYEISSMLLVGIVFLSIAYVQKLGGHLKVEFLLKRVGPKPQALLECIGLVLGIFVMTLLLWKSGSLAWTEFVKKDYAEGLIRIPAWPTRATFCVGIVLLNIKLIADLAAKVKSLHEQAN